jgi:signal transduction histidine kinase
VSDEPADVEHRVRTELTTISIASQLLQRDGLAGPRQQRLAGEILSACQRLQQYLDEWFAVNERISAE